MPTLADLWLARQHRDDLEKVPLVVPILTFFFFVAVFTASLDYRFTYVILFIVGLGILTYYGTLLQVIGSESKAKSVIVIPNYTLRASVVPIMVGVVLVGGPFFLYVIVSGATLTTSSPYNDLNLFITDVFIVAVTEEFFFRYVMSKIYGGILPQLFFSLSHPSVRNVILSNPSSAILPFLYFLIFGLVFQQLVFMGQASNIDPRYRRYFGLPLTTGIHGMYNVIAILFAGSIIFGATITPFVVR